MGRKKRIPLERKNAKLIAELRKIGRMKGWMSLDKYLAKLYLKEK